jgi:RNA polymerase sigma factor (sigma-70 family)
MNGGHLSHYVGDGSVRDGVSQMATGRTGAVIRQLDTLFTAGALGSHTDGQLLERFLDRRAGGEAAFEALVARHGPMVMGICRHVLGDPHDADDAFQATFLILVRRAGAIRKRESLGSWLYGVARRVAVRAKSDAARRRAKEPLAEGARQSGDLGANTFELRTSLHDEIDRLPEKYRAPVVLCDLEGQTHAEAAQQLQWPIGTVSGRLSRARELLKSRIVRRGFALSTGLSSALILSRDASATVVPTLIRSTVRLVLDFGANRAGAELGQSAVADSLARAVVRSSSLGKLKIAAGLLCAVTSFTAGGTVAVVDSRLPELSARRSVTHQATTTITEPPIVGRLTRETMQQGHSDRITSLAFAPDGRLLASGSRDKTVKLWDLATGVERDTLRGHSGTILSLAFAPDGKTLASASADHTVKVWDVATGREKVSVSLLPDENFPLVLDFGSKDSDRGGPGRSQCAKGSAQPACSDA